MTVREVVIMEQVLLGMSEDMAVWLKERKPTSLEELSKMADDYELAQKSEGARPGWPKASGLTKNPPIRFQIPSQQV